MISRQLQAEDRRNGPDLLNLASKPPRGGVPLFNISVPPYVNISATPLVGHLICRTLSDNYQTIEWLQKQLIAVDIIREYSRYHVKKGDGGLGCSVAVLSGKEMGGYGAGVFGRNVKLHPV